MGMAPKRKDDDVTKAKEEVAKDARAVGKAADSLLRVPLSDAHFGEAWETTVKGVDELDQEFSKEELMNKLRQKMANGDAAVRVIQIGPDGRRTDVSDKVSSKEPETPPLGRNPHTAEAALRLLQEMLPGVKLSNKGMFGSDTVSTSIRRMEEALTESDKILEHWKK